MQIKLLEGLAGTKRLVRLEEKLNGAQNVQSTRVGVKG